jgi:hypothetical protein
MQEAVSGGREPERTVGAAWGQEVCGNDAWVLLEGVRCLVNNESQSHPLLHKELRVFLSKKNEPSCSPQDRRLRTSARQCAGAATL